MPEVLSEETGQTHLLGMAAAGIIFDAQGRVLLIKENYGRRRYGPPGGAVEAGESPAEAMRREALEEICAHVRIRRLIGTYYTHGDVDWLAFVFHCEIERGEPAVPTTGEIAEVGWYHPSNLPAPLTSLAPYAIADALRGEYGLVRERASPESPYPATGVRAEP